MTIPSSPTVENCHEVCNSVALSGGYFYQECNLSPSTGEGSMESWTFTVHDPDDSPYLCPKVGGGYADYCSFGRNAEGDDYYCAWDETLEVDPLTTLDLTEVQVIGGKGIDYMFLYYDDGTNEFDLQEYSGFAGSVFTGRLFGNEGPDQLQGSRVSAAESSVYVDILNGGADDDTVCGWPGDDVLIGEYGNDTLCGDDDDDSLYGGPQSDTLCGRKGENNLLDGGPDNDELNYGEGGTNNGSFGHNDQCNNSTADLNCEDFLDGDECPS